MTTKKSKSTRKQNSEKIIDTLEGKLKKRDEEVKSIKQDLKEKEDKLLRSYADLQNYQKRAGKELQINRMELKKKYLTELIDIKELLTSAYEDNNPKKGLKLIIGNLDNFFEREQVKYIDCIGKTFDHNIHHAVNTIEKNDCENETIVEEVKKGYLLNDTLLRPSQVIVAKRNEDR
ncbi:MAG: nucleotide exchange factor GrpE [Candidatus Thermoplasmatota archaeon]|nr:nucleotide exchange factor GrpE [Candidatus Thermoplasmatota archaeon]